MIKKSVFYVIQVCIIALLTSCGSSGGSANEQPVSEEPSNEQEKSEPDLTSEDVANIGFLFESPGEALQALENISDEIDWNGLASFNRNTDYPSDQLTALNLGVAVTDALIAVKSVNVTQIATMNAVIRSLSEKLGVAETVGANKDSLALLVAQNKWDELTMKIEGIQASALSEMQSSDKNDLVNLVVLGGWFEGLNVITSHLAENYNAEHTRLMNQGNFITYMQNNMSDEIEASLKENLNAALTGIQDITGSREQDGEFSLEEVQKINSLVKNFINSTK